MVSIAQKLLIKLFLKITLKSLTKAPTLYGNRKIKSGSHCWRNRCLIMLNRKSSLEEVIYCRRVLACGSQKQLKERQIPLIYSDLGKELVQMRTS